MITLKFNNRTSKSCSAEIITERGSCKIISEWYASHHAGDRFTIYIDGVSQKKNPQGALYE